MPTQFDDFIVAIQKRLAEIVLAAIMSSFVVVGSLWLDVRDIGHRVDENRKLVERAHANLAGCSPSARCDALDERIRVLERQITRLEAKLLE